MTPDCTGMIIYRTVFTKASAGGRPPRQGHRPFHPECWSMLERLCSDDKPSRQACREAR